MNCTLFIINIYAYSYNSIEYFQGVNYMDDRKNPKPDIKSQTSKNERAERSHNFIMENRQKMTLTGILNVENFNEQEIILETELGMLSVKGTSLHMNKLNLESGDLCIDGDVNSCIYSEKQDLKTKGAGFFSKLFK
jgi:sporulation protein YabP